MKTILYMLIMLFNASVHWLKWRGTVEKRLARIEGRLDTVIELIGGEKNVRIIKKIDRLV